MTRRAAGPRARLTPLVTCVLLCGGASAAGAQEVWSGALLQTYVFGEADGWDVDRMQVLAVPFGATGAVGPLTLDLVAAWARAIATYSGAGSVEIAGPTDPGVSATLHLGAFTFTGFGVIPASEATYSVDEVSLLGMTSSDLLPLAVRTWGTGGGLGGAMGLAGRIGSTSFDVSGGFFRPGAYQPLIDTTPAYRPGSRVRVRGALDQPVGTAGALSLAVGHQVFLDDVYDDAGLVRPAARTEASVAFTGALGARESASVYARYGIRSGGALRGSTEYLTTRHFPGVVDPVERSVLVAGLELRAQRSRFTVLPAAELRVLGIDSGPGAGWSGAAGVDVDYHPAWTGPTRTWVVSPRARVVFGSFERVSREATSFVGWEVGAALRWGRR